MSFLPPAICLLLRNFLTQSRFNPQTSLLQAYLDHATHPLLFFFETYVKKFIIHSILQEIPTELSVTWWTFLLDSAPDSFIWFPQNISRDFAQKNCSVPMNQPCCPFLPVYYTLIEMAISELHTVLKMWGLCIYTVAIRNVMDITHL